MPSYYMHLSLQGGRTPLMAASAGGHVGCVQLLLDRGAQSNLQNRVSAVTLYQFLLLFPGVMRA